MEQEKAYANALTDPKLNEQRELRKRIYQNVANTAKTVRLNIDNTLIDAAVKAVVYNKDNYGKDEDALSQLAWNEAKKLASKPGRKAKKKVGEITLRGLMPTTPEVESPSADEQKDN